MNEDRLAKLLLEDRQARVRRQRYIAPICFAWGRSYQPLPLSGDDSTRFCGRTCREAYDAGYMPKPELDPFSVKWADGVTVNRRTDRIPNDELIRPRRPCLRCGGNMPVWIRGKRVSASRKFCPGCT